MINVNCLGEGVKKAKMGSRPLYMDGLGGKKAGGGAAAVKKPAVSNYKPAGRSIRPTGLYQPPTGQYSSKIKNKITWDD